jgi:ribosome-associated protein
LSENDVLQRLVDAAHQRHGEDVVAMDMTSFPLTVDVFLLVTSTNRVQSRAIADRIAEVARDMDFALHHKEGYREGSWILMDYIDFVVHIFLPEKRRYYGLEMLWSDAPVRRFPDEGAAGHAGDSDGAD